MRSFTSTSSENRVRDLSANKRMTGSESSEAVRSPCCVPPTDPPFAMNDKMLVVNLNYAISAIKPAICLLRKYFLPKSSKTDLSGAYITFTQFEYRSGTTLLTYSPSSSCWQSGPNLMEEMLIICLNFLEVSWVASCYYWQLFRGLLYNN